MKNDGNLSFQGDFPACLVCMRQSELGFQFLLDISCFNSFFAACELAAAEGGGKEREKMLSRKKSTILKIQKCLKAGFTAETGGRKGFLSVSRA